MARNEVTVNVQLDDKQLKSLADEIRETFAKRIEELESRIAKVREIAEGARALPAELCRCSSTVGGHDIGCSGVIAAVAWTLDPQEILAVLDGEGEKGLERPLIDDLWRKDWDCIEDAAYDKENTDG